MITAALLEAFPGLLHGFTARSGGRSTAPFNTLNLAYHVGDDDAAVDTNHTLLAERLGYARHRLVHMRQIHSDTVVQCTPGMDFGSRPECDGLITDIAGQPLMVMTADCTPVLFFDPVRRAVAAVHAGRAGAFKNIVGKCVAMMQTAYGTAPSDLRAVLGPSIHACCYEIGPEIAAESETKGYAGALERREGRFYLDVNHIIETQLQEAGLLSPHVETIGACTSCANGRFFSYRADRNLTGRQAGIIMLK